MTLRVILGLTRLAVLTVVTLFLVPIAVLALTDAGLAGSWLWLPTCFVLVVISAGACAIGVCWPHRRLVRVMTSLTVAWALLVLSVPYWPGVVTRADLDGAFSRLDYAPAEPSVVRGAGFICFPFENKALCPWLSARYLILDGDAHDAVDAVEAAGFKPVGPRRRVPARNVWSATQGRGWEYRFKGNGLMLVVTVVVDRQSVRPVPGQPGAAEYRPLSGETVEIRLMDVGDVQAAIPAHTG